MDQRKPNSLIEGREAVYQRMVSELERNEKTIDRNLLSQSVQSRQERSKKSFRQEKFEHGNLEIDMIGVTHIAETIPLYRKEMEEKVKASDFTILETANEFDSPELARGRAALTDKDDFFFLEVERMIRKHQKSLVIADPAYDYGDSPKKYQDRLFELDAEVAGLAKLAGLGAAVTGGGIAVERVISKTGALISKKLGDEDVDPSLSRRDFLRLSAASAVAAGGYSVLTDNHEHASGYRYQGNRATLYNLTDYRDAVVAEGINKLSQSFSKKMKAALVFGAAHIDGIKYYLDNPVVRMAKLKIYKPYQEISHPELSAHRFEVDTQVTEKAARDGNFGEWKQVFKTAILT